MSAGQTSDEILLERSASGEEAAFAELYRRRQAGIYRYALQMSGNTALAEEVTQEVFLFLIREPHRFDPTRGSVSGWLFGIARKQVLRFLEKGRNWVPIEVEDGPELPSEEEDTLGRLTRDELHHRLRQSVLSLPPAYREAIVLCDLQEFSYADAAEALGVPVGTVRSRLNRGRSLLLAKLRPAGSAASGGSDKTLRYSV